jgi:predicted ATPase/class 3 adenylate cyclase
VATIADFLKSIGMAEYAAGLSDSGIDVSALRSLTEHDLERLGIAPGDRNRLLRAIAGFDRDPEPAAPADRRSNRGVERRHLTILFGDLVGSTAISTRLDPEALHEIMGPYRKRCADVIEQAGGFVARYLGDGVLAYFGYPEASEDAAERAVNAGLALAEAVGQLRDDTGRPLQTRVGIASGLVLIGDLVAAGAPHDHDVVGETPNLAARLQANAEPGSVIISGDTHHLVGRLFECVAIDAQPLKGFATPMESWRVVKRSEIVNRFRALRSADTLLVGRKQETDLMVGGWESAKAGKGSVLLISGEPGIGKSRMVETLLNQLDHEQQHVRIRYFCAPNRQDSTLYPVVAQIERAAGISREDAAGQKLDKLEAMLGRASADLAEAAPLIAELLSIPTEGRYPPLELTPQKRREKTLQALMAQLEGSARQPTLVVFEDVHWIDATSLELLSLAVDRAPKLPLLLLVTFRPEFVPPWLGRSHVTQINLDRLSRERSAELIADLTRDRVLAGATVDQIIDRTDGVPLFIEELTKVLVERRGASPPAREIPATLRDMLTARLDRMGAAKEVAQIASVIGNEFSARLLGDVAPIAEERLNTELKKLVEAELLFEQGDSSLTSYRFKHALIQEAAYQSLVRGRRQHYHRKIAETLRERFSDVAEAQPEILAHHYSNSDLREAAIPYLRAAAEKSMRRSANPEAIAHLTKAQELLNALPEGPERLQQELALQLAIGTPLIATKGFASPEVGKVYARAREICELAGHAPELFPVQWGLWVFYTARGEHRTAQQLAEQCRRMGDATNDSDLLMLAHHALGVTLSALGQHSEALGELEQAIAIHDSERHASTAFAYGQDSGVVCRSQAAFSLWFLGYPDQARRKNEEAVALAKRLNHPYSLAAALDFSAWVDQLRGDSLATQEHAEEAIAISSKHDFVFWLLTGMILRGWALTARDQVVEGLAQMGQALAGYEQTGAGILRPYYQALLADVYGSIGRQTEASQMLDEAEATVQANDERWWEAELYRLKGELTLEQRASQTLQSDSEGIAEAYFDKARRVASGQGAKSLELRAATSLGRLWMKQGKIPEARQLLSESYGWFTEGFDLSDLRAAKTLIEV